MDNTIGIDVSKDTLDLHRLADGQYKQFWNGKSGHAQLIKWLGKQPDPLVIFEATGGIIGNWSGRLAPTSSHSLK